MKYIKAVLKYRKDIYFLSKQNIKKQYAGTTFGTMWAVTQPFLYMITFYFFYKVGLKYASDEGDIPFILFIFAAQMPWIIISQTLVQGCKCFTKNAILIKTIRFPVMSLPLIETLSKLYVHVVVMLITFCFFAINGLFPSLIYLNFIYYWLLLVVFLTGIVFLLGTMSVVLKDVPSLVQSIMQPLFWATPVLWLPDEKWDLIMRIFNPFYFFIRGYRETLIYKVNFWDDFYYDLYFLSIVVVIYVLGLLLYKKVRPIMADFI